MTAPKRKMASEEEYRVQLRKKTKSKKSRDSKLSNHMDSTEALMNPELKQIIHFVTSKKISYDMLIEMYKTPKSYIKVDIKNPIFQRQRLFNILGLVKQFPNPIPCFESGYQLKISYYRNLNSIQEQISIDSTTYSTKLIVSDIILQNKDYIKRDGKKSPILNLRSNLFL